MSFLMLWIQEYHPSSYVSVNDNSGYGFPDVLTSIFTNLILILFSFYASAYVCVTG